MKLSEMYPSRFLRGQDISAAILVEITGIERDQVHPRPGVTETKYILRFNAIKPASLSNVERTPHGYGVILRKALANQVAGILGSDDTDAWMGQHIVLEPTPTRAAGRDVTTISARAPRQAKPAVPAVSAVERPQDQPSQDAGTGTASETTLRGQ